MDRNVPCIRLEFVRKYFDHPMLGFPPDVSVIDKSDAVALLEEVLPLLPLNHYKNLWDPLLILRISLRPSRVRRTN